MATTKQIGDTFEQLACDFLTKNGLHIIQTNYNVPNIGEIDIVACQNLQQSNGQYRPILVFVEVKARQVSRFATAAQSVTKTKQRRLVRAAWHFLQIYEQFVTYECRFDVVAFDLNQNQPPSMQWIQGAFLADDACV